MNSFNTCSFNVEFAKIHGIDAAIVHDFLFTYKYLSNMLNDEDNFPSEETMMWKFPFWSLEHIHEILLYLKNEGLR